MGRILVVDDEGKMRALLAMALDIQGHTVEEAVSAEDALKKLNAFDPQVIISDVRMPGLSGLELLRTVKADSPAIECIIMTAFADAKTGIEAMRLGALEYVAKPFEMDEMLLLVKNALEKNALRTEVDALRLDNANRHSLGRIVGRSKAIQETIRQAQIVAKRGTTVLILGKSGTGKELVARGIHAESGRSAFVAVNCGALPDTLLETELFGHEKGSFTGASSRKEGLFETARDGTIFLDEIGDISTALQVKLLRVLQEREFTRVGGTKVITTNARVITATNRDLQKAVSEGEFREDLFYRLSVFPIAVPSLSDRIEDIPALVDAFCKNNRYTCGISPGVMEKLLQYSWPGNVRELENCIERAIILAGEGPITLEHIPVSLRENRLLDRPRIFPLPECGISLDDLEKNLVLQALERSCGNKTKAAQLLGISRRAMYSKMKTHGIAGGEDEKDQI